MADWDVDKYKSPHEPSHQWELRRKFMVQNKERYPEIKVVCLAQTFANIEFMGCRYPKETMELVEEMAYGVVQEFRDQQKGRLKRTFVGAADAAGAKVNRGTIKFESAQKQVGGIRGINFVPAAQEPPGKTPDHPRDEPLPRPLPCHGTFEDNFEPEPPRKMPAYAREGPSGMSHPAPRQQQGDLRARLDQRRAEPGYGSRQEHNSRHRHHHQQQRNRRQFILIRTAYTAEDDSGLTQQPTHVANIIQQSASFSKVPVEYSHSNDGTEYRCNMKLGTVAQFTGTGTSKKEARDVCCQTALDSLERECYTVLVKSRYLSDGTTVELPSASSSADQPASAGLEFNNVGHKLLKMMGWTGGGLGKGGQGISEPITAEGVSNRQGLGHDKVDAEFKEKMRTLVQEYAASTNPYDLVFANDFSSEERAAIHQIARKLSLKSKSLGKGEGRFLTISRKFDADQLINELLARGGENEKYELVPPKVE